MTKEDPELRLGFAQRFNQALKESGSLNADGFSNTKINELIGKRYGVSGKMVGYLRNGERQCSTATGLIIAKDLNVNFEWLMLGTGPQKPLSTEDQKLYEELQNAPEASKEAIRVLMATPTLTKSQKEHMKSDSQ